MSNEVNTEQQEKWKTAGDTDSHCDPLLDCLLLIAKLHGRNVTRTSLQTGLPLVQNCLTVELFSRAAGRADLSSRVLQRPLADVKDIELPAILLLKDKKACVLVSPGDDGKPVKILFPESGMGETEISQQDLGEIYTGYAIFVRPKYRAVERSLDDIQTRSTKNWFWGVIFSNWRIYRDVLFASLLINVLGLATPFYILNVYDRVIPNNAIETLWVLSIGIGIIYLFLLLMRGLRSYFIDEAGKKANLQISASLLEKVLGLRMEVRPKSVGSFSKNLQQFEEIRDFITSFSVTAIVDLPFVALGLFAVWYISGNLVLILIVAIVLLLAYALCIQVPLKKAVEKSFAASAQKNAILVDAVTGLETIKMLGAESQIQRAWEEAVSYIAKWSVKSRFLSSSVSNVANFVQNVAVVALVIGGVYKISTGNLSQGGLIALMILSRQAIAPMTQVVGLITRFHRAKAALRTLNEIMDLPVERPPGKAFLHRTRFDGAIELKNITFSYQDQSSDILKNVSLQIAAGERVGIVGPIGSGKTTLGKLILGLYEPDSGMISMDGTDIRQIDPAELRRCIGYVSQDVTLFRGSVRENIILGTRDIDDDVILQAAELAGVSEIVKKHAVGYDLQVGEQGRNLSGGQRQCVALARAILLDPPLLVLDEPTSSMDNRTEQRIKDRLQKILEGKSLLLITHRASMLQLVDRIIVLDNGHIVADGSRDSVLEALRNGQLNL
ncbi:MAG: type I secretion system permease/ATPase [Desulfobulbaceae bacterium]|uniref:Type I secretion system permease/ATPase n=1 Tax=Candidatus Desulfobia pelagia TaxID=2841692 RepID=A0A8J6NDC7_9BACT|nr:type I secretion system permease/ATPase [Candidatus Desulfobia pelagia]